MKSKSQGTSSVWLSEYRLESNPYSQDFLQETVRQFSIKKLCTWHYLWQVTSGVGELRPLEAKLDDETGFFGEYTNSVFRTPGGFLVKASFLALFWNPDRRCSLTFTFDTVQVNQLNTLGNKKIGEGYP